MDGMDFSCFLQDFWDDLEVFLPMEQDTWLSTKPSRVEDSAPEAVALMNQTKRPDVSSEVSRT